jgi:hypothetical protein
MLYVAIQIFRFDSIFLESVNNIAKPFDYAAANPSRSI